MADAFESQARLAIATTGFESAEEGRYTQLIGCSSQLRVAHRGAVEAARLLGLLDPTDAYEVRACLEGVGSGLETLATYTGGGIPRPADEKSREIRRLHSAVEGAGQAAFGSLAQALQGGGDETLVRMGTAANLCLLICAEGLMKAATRTLEARNPGTRETRLERLGGI